MSVVVLTLLLAAIAVRLTQLQGFQASAYAEAAEQQRQRTFKMQAVRGAILDRHGATFALDIEARAVYADPRYVDDPAAAAKRLSTVLDVPAQEIEGKLRQDLRFVYLARGLDIEVGDAVTALKIAGVNVLDERRRVYPGGQLAANVVGFTQVGDPIVGGGGIESAFDALLRGTDGERRLEMDPAGRVIPSNEALEEDPVPGWTIRLTLDRDIQWRAQEAIAEAVRSTQADGGTVLVTDPRTGDILAMADAPTFDPNDVSSADPGTLGNGATGDVHEPGSTNKVITMAAALDRGLITPTTPITVPSNLLIGGETFRDSEPHGTEHLTAAGVLVKSSNIGTVLISQKMEPAQLEDTLRAFGLGEPTGLGFPGESGGLLAPAEDWSASQAATIAYGQGMSATSLQMTSVYATVANGGVRVKPRLIDAKIEPDGTANVEPVDPGTRVVREETASTLTDMLEAVVSEDGTAPGATVPGYRVAGKTGTAKRFDATCRCYQGYVSSFIGFAPADDPRVVVSVMLDNPRVGYYAGQVATPTFRDVMTFSLSALGVTSSGRPPRPLVLETDAG